MAHLRCVKCAVQTLDLSSMVYLRPTFFSTARSCGLVSLAARRGVGDAARSARAMG